MGSINNQIKVGAFVLIIAIITGYLIITFGGEGLGRDYKEYVVYFNDVEGLTKGADVQVKGVKAGRVKDVLIDEKTGKVKVILGINEDIPIYKNAKVYIKTLGLMGDKFVYIDPGSPSYGKKEDNNLGEGIKYAGIGDTINNVNEAITKGDLKDLIVSIRLLAKHIDALVQENRENIRQTTENLKVITGSLRESIPRIVDKIDRIATNLEQITGENKEDIRQLIANLKDVSAELKKKTPKLLDDIDDTALTIKGTIEENRGNIKEAIINIKNSAGRLESILTKIDKGQGTIGKLINEDTLYNDLRSGINAFSEPFKIIKRSRLDIKLYGEVHTGNDDSKAGIAGIFSPRPDRYIYVGMLSNSNGTITKTEEIISNGTTTRYDKREYGILFDIQYARRFLAFGENRGLWIRGGIKDSSGDIGLDYQFNENLILKSDLYNFGRKYATNEPDKPQLDVYLNYRIPNYPFFVGVGGSDLLNDKYRGIYIGGGFIFSDNDLKYILGSMPKP